MAMIYGCAFHPFGKVLFSIIEVKKMNIYYLGTKNSISVPALFINVQIYIDNHSRHWPLNFLFPILLAYSREQNAVGNWDH